MQAGTLTVTGRKNIKQIFTAVAEKIEGITNSTYVSISLMISLIGLTAWFITFKVNSEANFRQLFEENLTLKMELKEMKVSLPSKDWLELKFQNLQDQLPAKKYQK